VFDPSVMAAIRRDAVARFPEESCGLVIEGRGYVPFANVAPEPELDFEMPLAAAEAIAAGGAGAASRVLAVVHSHTNGRDHPSSEDIVQQIAQGIPYGLTVTDGGDATEPLFWGDSLALEVPYLERIFRWGPTGTDGKGDCWALARDWYRRERGILFPDFPRDGDWQDDRPDQYDESWAPLGFRRVLQDDAQPGDLVLFSIRHRGRANHAGILLEGGQLLHHQHRRRSCSVYLGDWQRDAVAWLRPPAG
jgi:proteasome lid subunit RPN8/RPN11